MSERVSKPDGEAPSLLFVVNDAPFFLSHRLPIAIAAKAAGYIVHVATPPGAAAAIVEQHGLVFHGIRLARKGTRIRQELQTFFSLLALYLRLRPDIVHHVTIKPILYGGVAARIARVPGVVNAISGLGHVFIAEGRLADFRRQFVENAYRVALGHRNSRAIVQNPDDYSTLVGRRIICEERLTVIRGSGVDLACFRPVPEPSGEPTVVLAGRMLAEKGVREFAHAAERLKRAGVTGSFVLVGDTDPGNPTSISEAQLRQWSSRGIVDWRGYSSDMPGVIAGAHVVCLPSYREGLPKVLIEAAASGRPIVTTDVPGCREVVRHGENGFLVPPRDSDALADALRLLLADAGLRARMGRRGREIAEATFSLTGVVAAHMQLYKQLFDGVPSRVGA